MGLDDGGLLDSSTEVTMPHWQNNTQRISHAQSKVQMQAMQAFLFNGRPFGKTHEHDSQVENEEAIQRQDYKEDKAASGPAQSSPYGGCGPSEN